MAFGQINILKLEAREHDIRTNYEHHKPINTITMRDFADAAGERGRERGRERENHHQILGHKNHAPGGGSCSPFGGLGR